MKACWDQMLVDTKAGRSGSDLTQRGGVQWGTSAGDSEPCVMDSGRGWLSGLGDLGRKDLKWLLGYLQGSEHPNVHVCL